MSKAQHMDSATRAQHDGTCDVARSSEEVDTTALRFLGRFTMIKSKGLRKYGCLAATA